MSIWNEQILGRLSVHNPAPADIVFGRGGFANRHEGNKVYLEFLEKHEIEYMKTPRKYQKLLSLCIIHYFHTHGARFLKKDEKTDKWCTAKLSLCRLKISQRLRERGPVIKTTVGQVQSLSSGKMPQRKRKADWCSASSSNMALADMMLQFPPPVPLPRPIEVQKSSDSKLVSDDDQSDGCSSLSDWEVGSFVTVPEVLATSALHGSTDDEQYLINELAEDESLPSKRLKTRFEGNSQSFFFGPYSSTFEDTPLNHLLTEDLLEEPTEEAFFSSSFSLGEDLSDSLELFNYETSQLT